MDRSVHIRPYWRCCQGLILLQIWYIISCLILLKQRLRSKYLRTRKMQWSFEHLLSIRPHLHNAFLTFTRVHSADNKHTWTYVTSETACMLAVRVGESGEFWGRSIEKILILIQGGKTQTGFQKKHWLFFICSDYYRYVAITRTAISAQMCSIGTV